MSSVDMAIMNPLSGFPVVVVVDDFSFLFLLFRFFLDCVTVGSAAASEESPLVGGLLVPASVVDVLSRSGIVVVD